MPIGFSSVSKLPAVKFDGVYRVLGMIPSSPEKRAKFPSFAAHFMGAAPVEWQEIDLSHYNPTVENQMSSSSCVGHGCGSGMEVCWMQMGKQKKELSNFFVYGLINNGADQGASISDAMEALMNIGICPKEYVAPGLMFKSQFSKAAFEEASKYKLLRAFRCDSFEEVMSALSLGFSVPLGILVGSNFANLDVNGVAPLPNSGGGGHCILGLGTRKFKGEWQIKIFNSWGLNFGERGYCWLRKEHFRYYNTPDAFAIQSMNDPNSEIPVAA